MLYLNIIILIFRVNKVTKIKMNILRKSTEGIIQSIPIIPVFHLYIYPIAGTDPGEGHRGQMTPFRIMSGKPKMMYWYENIEFKLLFLNFYKIKTIYTL